MGDVFGAVGFCGLHTYSDEQYILLLGPWSVLVL